jgi:hypothetical protein
MTLPEAIEEIRRVGSLTVESGKLKVRFLEAERSRLAPALAVLRANRAATIERVSEPAQAGPSKSTLANTDPEAAAIPYCEWAAQRLNRIFEELGTAGPGRIQPETVTDGLEKYLRPCRARDLPPPTKHRGGTKVICK